MLFKTFISDRKSRILQVCNRVMAVWLSGNVQVMINKVARCRARLVPAWVTLWWVNHLGTEPATQVYSAWPSLCG